MVSNFNMGHTQLVKEKIKKSVPEIDEIKFVSIMTLRLRIMKIMTLSFRQKREKKKIREL